MTPPLLAPSASNNFDLLRLLFAGLVCVVHAFDLSGIASLSWTREYLSSMLAIKGFFVISGYLIMVSFERSRGWRDYADRRFRRIYPAYAAIVLICALGLVLVSTRAPMAFFTDADWWRYLAANLAFLNFLQHELPGVFEGHRVEAVNGALWTLKIEVMFYASVPIIVWAIRRYGARPILLAGFIVSTLYSLVFEYLGRTHGVQLYDELARQLPGQLRFFLAGAACFYLPGLLDRHRIIKAILAVILIRLDDHVPALSVLEPIALATLVILAARIPRIPSPSRWGDFSYGVYIVHFPVIQLAVHFGLIALGGPLFLMITMALTLVGGVCSWHLVEKRFLRRDSHYRQVAEGSTTPA